MFIVSEQCSVWPWTERITYLDCRFDCHIELDKKVWGSECTCSEESSAPNVQRSPADFQTSHDAQTTKDHKENPNKHLNPPGQNQIARKHRPTGSPKHHEQGGTCYPSHLQGERTGLASETTHTHRETQATSTGTNTAALLDKKDWLPPVTRNVAGQDPPARHEASGRSVKGKRPSPVTARYSGGGICTTGGHLGAWGSGHSSEGHTKPPNAFPSTLTLLHPQSKRVRSGDDDNERSIAICRPPMMEQRSSGNRSRQQLVLQARRCVTELGVEMSDHWSWFLDKPNLKANSVRKKINLHATPLI